MLKFKSIKNLNGKHLFAKKTEVEEVLSGKKNYLPVYQTGLYVVDFGSNSIVYILDDEIVIPISSREFDLANRANKF